MKARLAGIFRERRNLYLLALWLSILGMDQATKALVKNLMSVGESIPADTPIRLTYVQNTGSAFGLFPNQTFALTIAAVVGVVVIAFVFFRSGGNKQPVGNKFDHAVGWGHRELDRQNSLRVRGRLRGLPVLARVQCRRLFNHCRVL